jgi:hypothetical protein
LEIRVDNRVNINAILDSGSEVNLLAQRAYDKLIKSGVDLPTLPVQGVVLVTAFGKRSDRIRNQTLVSFTIGEDLFEGVFLISSQLVSEAILGGQLLKEYGLNLDFERDIVSYVREGAVTTYPFSSEKQVVRSESSDIRETKKSVHLPYYPQVNNLRHYQLTK